LIEIILYYTYLLPFSQVLYGKNERITYRGAEGP